MAGFFLYSSAMTKPTHHIPFFDLKTPADLFHKAEHDLAALEKAPTDSYTAFNLFVTLEHLPDWLGQREPLRKNGEWNVILRTVSHVANGAKHFDVDDHRHQSVTNLEETGYAEPGYVEDGYVGNELTIWLSPDEQKELRCKNWIGAITLARMAIDFWRPYLQTGP